MTVLNSFIVFWGCSDVVESRVGHPILDIESRRMQLLLRIRNSPSALAIGDARTSDDDSVCRAGPFIDELGDLSIDREQRGNANRSGHAQ